MLIKRVLWTCLRQHELSLKRQVTKGRLKQVREIQTLHLSPNFLVVNKQYDMAVLSKYPGEHAVTVASQLNDAYPHLRDSGAVNGFRFCHCIDYATSGILCVALTKVAAKQFSASVQTRSIKKYYLALVHGHIADECLIINKGIGVDSRPEHTHMMCAEDKEYCRNAVWALTKLLVLQRGLYDSGSATKTLIQLCTGRRHQLRVHCNDIGHAIVGDYTYSDRQDVNPHRMFLHSYRMTAPLQLENLDICTEDPFTEHDPCNKWVPTETVNVLDEKAFSKVSSVKP